MTSEATGRRPGPASGPLRVPLLLAWLVALGFVVAFAAPYFTLDQTRFGRFSTRHWWLLAHVVPGTVLLLIGPIQIWLATAGHRLDVHRVLGRVYLGAGAATTAAGVGLAVQNHIGWVYGVGLLGLAASWLTTTGVAWLAIRRRHIEQHREWMIRSVVVTFSFVWFRLVFGSAMVLGLGTEDERFIVGAWSCWSFPLLITEVCLQARRLRVSPAARS